MHRRVLVTEATAARISPRRGWSLRSLAAAALFAAATAATAAGAAPRQAAGAPASQAADAPQAADPTMPGAGTGEAAAVPRSQAEAFVRGRGWTLGRDAASGQFTAIGVAAIEGGAGGAVGAARAAAFEAALLDAKAQMARAAGEAISRESESLVVQGTPGTLAEVQADAARGGRSLNDVAVAVLADALVAELRSRGVDLKAAGAARPSAESIREILATRRMVDLVSSLARAGVAGVTAFQVFERLDANGRGELAVVAVQTDRSRQIASAAAGNGRMPLMMGGPRPPIANQLGDDARLLRSFGVQPRFDEQGHLVLVAVGQAAPLAADAAGTAAAGRAAELAAKGALRSFVGEAVVADQDLLTVKDASTYADGATRDAAGQAFSERIRTSAAGLTMDGLRTIVPGKSIVHPATGAPVVVAVVAWAPPTTTVAAPAAPSTPAAAPPPVAASTECPEGPLPSGATQVRARGTGATRAAAIWSAIHETVMSRNGVVVQGSEELRRTFDAEVKQLNDAVDKAVSNREKLDSDVRISTPGGTVRRFRVLDERTRDGLVEVDLCMELQEFEPGAPRQGSLPTLAILPFDPALPRYNFATPPAIRDGECGSVERVGADLVKRFQQDAVTALLATRRFRILDRENVGKVLAEQSLVRGNSTDPAELARLGRLMGADWLLVGTLELIGTDCRRLEVRASGYVTHDYSGGMAFTWRLVNAQTSELRGTSRLSRSFDSRQSPELKGVLSNPDGAIGFFYQQAAPALVGAVLDVVDPVKVAAVQNGEVILNQGRGRPMSPGMRLRVMGVGEAITDPDSGAVLSRSTSEVAIIEVVTVEERISRARVLGGDAAKVVRGAACELVEVPPPGGGGGGAPGAGGPGR